MNCQQPLESKENRLVLLIMGCFVAISLGMTTQTYLNWDVSWLLEASRRLLSGGTYSQHFMETNPPLILFLYAIPVLLTSWMGNLVSNFLIFIYAISIVSLSLSYLLLKPIMKWKGFFVGLVFCELVLPSFEFGQREHLTFLFIIPYLLLISSKNTVPFPAFLRLIVGLMAGIGFSIKPHFLIPLIFILAWQLYKNTCCILENGCIFGFMLLYLASSCLITPDYFSVILPLVFKFYLGGKESLSSLLMHQWSILFYLITLSGMISLHQKQLPYPDLYSLLQVANFGFFLVFLIGGHFFYYHFLVVASLSVLLLVLSMQCIAKSFSIITKIPKIEYFHASLLSFCLLFILEMLVDYDLWIIKRDTYGPTRLLLKIFEQIHQGPFAVFSNYVAPNASLMTYSQLHSSTRLHQFWLLPGIAQLEHEGKWSLAEEGKNLLRQILIQDLIQDPPYIIVVDESAPPIIIGGQTLNYLHFLLEDPKFKVIWHRYNLTTRIASPYGNYAVYTL